MRPILSFLILTTLSIAAQARVLPTQFGQWLQEAEQPGFLIAEEFRSRAAHFRYVFVNGYRNEVRHGDFQDEVSQLRALGVPADAILILKPSSENSVAENIPFLLRSITAFAAKGPERIVLIGHSKGATEALATALAAPQSIVERIQVIFLLQGPFHGSPLATLAAHLPGVTSLFKYGRGVFCLAPKAMNAFWKKYLAAHIETVRQLDDRIYYVTSYETEDRMPPKLRPGAEYMELVAGDNDGLVPLRSQSLDELGTRLDALRAYHNLTVSALPRTRAAVQFRSALTQAIFETAAAQE